MDIPRIQSAGSLKGKRVLLRLGLNVPVKNGRIVDDFRLRRAIPTIEYLQKKKAKVIVIGHIGRDPKETLAPVGRYLSRALGEGVELLDTIESAGNTIEALAPGGVVLLENVRKYPGEKKNNTGFAKRLASLGDLYVNDAFSVSHRKHASVYRITKFLPSYAGLLFQDEVKHLESVLHPRHPFLFMLGGAKIKTKMPLLRKFASIADSLFVGGALANDIYKARGFEVGKSLVDDTPRGVKALSKNKKIIVPVDVRVAGRAGVRECLPEEVKKSEQIMDAGKHTEKLFADLLHGKKTVLLNGPLGYYEGGYDTATKALLKELAKSSAKVIVGGGDTVALVTKMKLEDSFHFLSTGGGAMLDFLADGKLPGIDALQMKIKK